jgi:hypothetical protein
LLRLYYYPIHFIYLWPIVRGEWYSCHPVAWDDFCSLPFAGLDRLLVDYAEKFPSEGLGEIVRLIDEYPSQRMAALRARARWIARQCARANRLEELTSLVAGLPEGNRGFLAQTASVSKWIGEIANLQAKLETVPRPFFREPLARSLRAEIEAFEGRVAGYHEPLASEFRTAARQWLEIADRQWKDAQAVVSKTLTPAVFRAGDPVDRTQEAFVERIGVVGELEGQIMLGTGCPGVLLYGRRRMGKSTVLRNLAAFLPPKVHVALESLQNPQAFSSIEGFVGQVTQGIRKSIAHLDPPTETPSDLAPWFVWLGEVNRRLLDSQERLLLALDEYEKIDEKIGQGVFNQDLLNTLRESIQSHRRITWVLTGSHDVTELRQAPWPSYLASVRMVEVPPFVASETRLLLTEPMKHCPVWKADDPARPRFDPTFWGEEGIEWIHAEAGGWPHLVQLLAETAVDLVNQSTETRLEPARREAVLDRAVVRGDNVLRLLMQTESELPGEWEYLLAFRRCDLQPPPEDERLYTSLRRRLLVEDHDNQFRLRVPLMQRWLCQRG